MFAALCVQTDFFCQQIQNNSEQSLQIAAVFASFLCCPSTIANTCGNKKEDVARRGKDKNVSSDRRKFVRSRGGVTIVFVFRRARARAFADAFYKQRIAAARISAVWKLGACRLLPH